MSRIRVLGIDPGFANIGLFGLTRLSPGVKAEWCRLILTEKDDKAEGVYKDEVRRLDRIEVEFSMALDDYRPDVVASERYASVQNAISTRQIALAFAAMHALARRRGLPFLIFDPEQIKMEMCGSRKAKKPAMVRALKGMFPGFGNWPSLSDKKRSKTVKKSDALCHIVDAAGAAVLASKLDLDAEIARSPRVTVVEIPVSEPSLS
jgi:Holliday junction resolvasome RuvABC endonuclease subunit